jgi:hypothetical protein
MYIVAAGAVIIRPGGSCTRGMKEGSDRAADVGNGLRDAGKCVNGGECSAREARVGDTFGGLALFPDLAGPARLDSAVGLAPGGLLYALPTAAAAVLAERYPELVARLRALCALEAIDSRARGGADGATIDPDSEMARRRSGLRAGAHPCRIHTRIAQLKVQCVRMCYHAH